MRLASVALLLAVVLGLLGWLRVVRQLATSSGRIYAWLLVGTWLVGTGVIAMMRVGGGSFLGWSFALGGFAAGVFPRQFAKGLSDRVEDDPEISGRRELAYFVIGVGALVIVMLL